MTPDKPEKAANLFEKMISAHKEKRTLSLIKEKQYMTDLVCYYLQCCQETNITLVENTFDAAIDKAISHANKNMDRSVSVVEMAEIAGYHPSHFTKLFRQRFGVSPAQFLIQKNTLCHGSADQYHQTNSRYFRFLGILQPVLFL